MTDPSQHPAVAQLIGVYETLEQAYEAADRARQAGAPEAFVDDPADKVAALRAEMRAELEGAVITPTAALALPKESMKGVGVLAPIGMVVGALLALPLAWIDWGVPFSTGLVIVVVCGAAMGATVAFLVGAGTALRGRFEANAADRGVTVRVPVDTPAIEHALDHGGVIRLDRVDADGNPDVALATEADHEDGGVLEDMVGHVQAAPHVAGINDESDPHFDPEDPATSPSIEHGSIEHSRPGHS
jgi:hypothetical protein